MQKKRWAAFAASALVAAALDASATSASPNAFNGHVCSLVTTSATRAANVHAPCTEQTQTTTRTAAATWGTASGPHYLSVHVGALLPVMHPLGNRLQPRLPRWHGPIQIAPGINAYFTLSNYRGTADRAGAMRFTEQGNLVTISLIDASADALRGLTEVAKSIEQHL